MRANRSRAHWVFFLAATGSLLAPLVRADDRPPPRKDRPVDKVPIPPMKPFNPPQATSFTLKNGITCFVLEDHDVPLVEVRALVRAGSIWDPEDKVGLASLAGHVWRTGGTIAHPKDKLDQVLDKRGAILEASVGLDQGSLHLQVLKEDADLGLSLLRELLEQPAFPEEKLKQAKTEQAVALRRRNDSAPAIAGRVFNMRIFGKTSPVAREIDRASLAAVKRDDLVSWHKQFVHPSQVLLGCVGDLDVATAKAKLEKALESWSPGEAVKHEMPLVEVSRKASWTVCPKADVNQSMIMIGHVGAVRSPKTVDEFAQRLCMDLVLGGNGFASRLMMHVRTDKGLAYDTGSAFGYDYGRPGTFFVYSGTESKRTPEAVLALMHEVDVVRNELCTDEELTIAKDSFLNTIPAEVDTADKVMSRTLRYAYWGFPQDFLKTLMEALARVTKEDVLRAAKEFIHPEAFTVVVCGNPKDFEKPLDSLTKEKVEVIEDAEAWAHPGQGGKAPGGEKPGADGEAVSKLLAKLVESAGGKKAIGEIATFKLTTSIEVQGQKIKVEFLTQGPDKLRQNVSFPQGKQSIVIDGAKGWRTGPDGKTVKIEGEELAATRDRFAGEPFMILRAAASGELFACIDGEEKIGEKQVIKLSVKPKDGKTATTILVDKETGALAGKLTDFMRQAIRYVYTEHKAVGGVTLPSKAEGRPPEDEGADEAPLKVTYAGEANPKLDEKTFAPPSEEK